MDGEDLAELLHNHLSSPRCVESPLTANRYVRKRDTFCRADLTYYLKSGPKEPVSISFSGQACSTTLAFSSLFLSEIAGKEEEIVRNECRRVIGLLKGEAVRKEELVSVHMLAVGEIQRFATRRPCAAIPYVAVLELLA